MITVNVNGVDLPPTIGTEEAAGYFGCSTDALYAAVRNGTAPIEPLRLGSRLRWPTARVLGVLGLVLPE